MAMRFDQIGSQQNVQNVGEGEAYVYEKQKSPLLSLGENAMKMKLAEDKAKAKAAAASGSEKVDLLTLERPSLNLTTYFNKSLEQIPTIVNKKGDPNAANLANTKVQKLNNLAKASVYYQTDFDRANDAASTLSATGKISKRVYDKKVAEITTTANRLAESNPNDYLEGLTGSIDYMSKNSPNKILDESSKYDDASIDKMASGIAQNTKTLELGLKSTGNITQEQRTTIKDKAIGDINTLVDKVGNSNAAINTYMDKFYENANSELNNPDNKKYFSTKKGEGFDELVGKNSKGEDIYIDEKSYSKDNFRKDLISKIDNSNILSSKLLQGYSTTGGLGGKKNAMFTPSTISAITSNENKTKFLNLQLGGSSYIPAKPSDALITIEGNGEGYVLNQPRDKKHYVMERVGAGEQLAVNGVHYTLTNSQGQSQLYDGIQVFDQNGNLDVDATSKNIFKKMDKGYKFGKKIGGFVSGTKLDKADVQAVSSADQLTEGQQSEAAAKAISSAMTKNLKAQILLPITGANSNVGRSAFSKMTGGTDISKFANSQQGDNNGKKLQKSLDIAFKMKEGGASIVGKNTAGSGKGREVK
jgi:hypothetical protein